MSNNENNDKDSNKDLDLESNSLQWSSGIDNLLAEWCDEAKCFEWMHAESYDINYKTARKFLVSINLLTAISGLSNVIAGGYSVNGFQISWIFGSISVLVSSLNMLQDKLGYQQTAETHKRLSGQWSKIILKIQEIVILPYGSRQDCKTFLKFIKKDINAVTLEGNSLISDKVRNDCYNKFKDVKNFNIPDVCGQLEHTKTFANNSIYNDLKTPNTSPKFTNKTLDKIISSKNLFNNTTPKASAKSLQENDNTKNTPLLNSVKIDN
jgi:hypothetical protein